MSVIQVLCQIISFSGMKTFFCGQMSRCFCEQDYKRGNRHSSTFVCWSFKLVTSDRGRIPPNLCSLSVRASCPLYPPTCMCFIIKAVNELSQTVIYYGLKPRAATSKGQLSEENVYLVYIFIQIYSKFY